MKFLRRAIFRCFLLFSLVSVVACKEEDPKITYIDPPVGSLGGIISIYGENFGPERNEFTYVTIAGSPPTGSSYISWEDNLVKVRVPEFSSAGLVYIHKGNKKSNPVLFADQSVIPEPVRGEESVKTPRISGIEPSSGPVGSLVTIYGNNFGPSRESRGNETLDGKARQTPGVYFSWDGKLPPGTPDEAKGKSVVEVFDSDFGYEYWGEREIRVRVPDGAITGNLEVRTSTESSPPVFFEVTGMPGTKTFKDKRSYSLSYTVDIKVEEAELPNSLFLWIPKPVSSSSQRNILLLSRSDDPFVENYRGTSLYQFTDLVSGGGKHITASFVADVYAIESNINPQNIKQETGSAIQNVYTAASALIPAKDGAVLETAAAIIARERNPYLKAKKIYEWIINEISFDEAVSSGGAPEALAERKADSYRASLLFCALARASGVPAIPAAGILIDRNRAVSRHYWAEFWIDSYGWIPLDPALGSGSAPASFNLREDYASYYFGNMDNSRVAFSRGEANLSQMDPSGRVALRQRDYALQNLWEEAAGGLLSYSSLWSDITIMGMYIQ